MTIIPLSGQGSSGTSSRSSFCSVLAPAIQKPPQQICKISIFAWCWNTAFNTSRVDWAWQEVRHQNIIKTFLWLSKWNKNMKASFSSMSPPLLTGAVKYTEKLWHEILWHSYQSHQHYILLTFTHCPARSKRMTPTVFIAVNSPMCLSPRQILVHVSK